MKRRLLFSLGSLAGAGLATLVSQTIVSPGADAASSETYRQLRLFGDVLEKVRSDYVEPPNEAKLIEGAINGMLTSLDPHSSYMSPNEFREMQVEAQGAFGGIGIEVTMEEGRCGWRSTPVCRRASRTRSCSCASCGTTPSVAASSFIASTWRRS